MNESAPDDRWTTLRELDRDCGLGKGAAFRAFKRLAPSLREAADFRVVDADSAEGAALRAADRCYASSVKLILLSAATAARLRDELTGGA